MITIQMYDIPYTFASVMYVFSYFFSVVIHLTLPNNLFPYYLLISDNCKKGVKPDSGGGNTNK